MGETAGEGAVIQGQGPRGKRGREGENGKPHWEDVVGWGEGWPSELECEARHLSHSPGESTNGGLKKNMDLTSSSPQQTWQLCAALHTTRGRGGRERHFLPPLQCFVSCSTTSILRRSLSTCTHSLEKGREWDTHLQRRDHSASETPVVGPTRPVGRVTARSSIS